MKTPPADLGAKELARVLRAEYGFDSGKLTFVPKGEDAYIYVTEAGYGPQFFVRAQDRKRARPLEEALRSAAQLRETCGLHEILAALPARGDAFTCRCGEYLIAVFPFIQGTTTFESGFSKPRIEQAARFIGRLHNCTPGVSLIRERFDNPFTQPILRALSQAESRPKTEIAVLLLQQREDLIRTLNRMERFSEELPQLHIHRVPTHGDPNLDNLLWDAEERLFVTDWGDKEALFSVPKQIIEIGIAVRGDPMDMELRQFFTEALHSVQCADQILSLLEEEDGNFCFWPGLRLGQRAKDRLREWVVKPLKY